MWCQCIGTHRGSIPSARWDSGSVRSGWWLWLGHAEIRVGGSLFRCPRQISVCSGLGANHQHHCEVFARACLYCVGTWECTAREHHRASLPTFGVAGMSGLGGCCLLIRVACTPLLHMRCEQQGPCACKAHHHVLSGTATSFDILVCCLNTTGLYLPCLSQPASFHVCFNSFL